jgi:hypothetical protein
MRRRMFAVVVLLAALLPAAASATPPTITYSLTGPAGDDGWYRGPVRINWAVSPDAEGASCGQIELVTADTAGTQRACTASNTDGSTTTTTKPIKIDQTPPTNLAAAPARPPDAPPFYTAPVAIAWSATDVTSGVAACTTTTYAGPDGPSVAPQGSCRDRAGNVSAPLALPFAYDATAPALVNVTATAAPDRTIALGWTTDADAQTVSVTRQPGAATLLDRAPAATTRSLTDGPLAAATAFTYTITARDAAGNATTAMAAATTPTAAAAAAALAQSKAKGKRKATTRTLRWKRRAGAKYYNVQLFRNGRKVLSAWPTANHYTVKARWRYRGRTHRLTSGRYRWYVWPGYGPRAAHRYGRLLAKGTVAQP